MAVRCHVRQRFVDNSNCGIGVGLSLPALAGGDIHALITDASMDDY